MSHAHSSSIHGDECHTSLMREMKLSLNRLHLLTESVARYAAEQQSDNQLLLNLTEATRRELEKLDAVSSEITLGSDPHKHEIRFVTVRLDRIIQQAVAQLWLDAELKDIELAYDTPPTPMEVAGDPELLNHAVQNVILNAIVSTSFAGFVGIEAEYETGHPRVIVTNTTRAIPKAALRKPSEGKAAAESTNRTWDRDDSVADLRFAREVMRLHGGRFVLEHSDDRQRRRFILKFPGKQPARGPGKKSHGRGK